RPPRPGRGRLADGPRHPRAPRPTRVDLLGRLGDVHPLLVLRVWSLGGALPARLPLLIETIMTNRHASMWLAAILALLARASGAMAQGCAMCGTAFAADDPVTRAFNWSVLFLIAMPYTIFGLAAGWLVLAH